MAFSTLYDLDVMKKMDIVYSVFPFLFPQKYTNHHVKIHRPLKIEMGLIHHVPVTVNYLF
jgi:hypothetical protein